MASQSPAPLLRAPGLLLALLVGALVRALQLWWAADGVPDIVTPMLDAGFHHHWITRLNFCFGAKT